MCEERVKEYKAFVKNAWAQASNHQKGINDISKDTFIIVSNPDGHVHATNAQRIKHIYDVSEVEIIDPAGGGGYLSSESGFTPLTQ